MSADLDRRVADLEEIRQLSWLVPDDFTGLEELYDHPVVVHRAKGSVKPAVRVRALEKTLKAVVKQLDTRERREGARWSAARASRILLRLDAELTLEKAESVDRLYEKIVEDWPRKRGKGNVSPGAFRQHNMKPEVYVPFAEEFALYAATYAERNKIPLGDGPDGWDFPKPPGDLDRIGRGLWAMEARASKERCDAIGGDMVVPRDSNEMLEMLKLLTDTASTFEAVDHIRVDQWTVEGSPLRGYLDYQLAKVRKEGVTLERIRLVSDEDLEDPKGVEQLARLVDMHEEAGASLLLCPIDEVIDTPFNSRVGMLLGDREKAPAAVTGWLSENRVQNAVMYPRACPGLTMFTDAYPPLRAQVRGRGLHDELLSRLNGLRKRNGSAKSRRPRRSKAG